jgi:Ca2+-binding EF-hand superfamily protein
MRTHIALGSAVALALGATLASAQFTPPTFDGIDTDKGGSLSKEEVGVWVATIPAGPNGPANADEVFGRWDANKDGSVSKEEFDSRPRPQGGPPPGN